MLVHKGGVINFEKTLRIRMIKPILLVKNQDSQLPSIGFDAARNNLTFTCWSELRGSPYLLGLIGGPSCGSA